MSGNLYSLRLRIRNSLACLAEAEVKVRRFLCNRGVDDMGLSQVMVIVDELASNIIRYAWRDQDPHGFDLGLSLQASNGGFDLELTLVDDGSAFDPTQVPPADLARGLNSREPGGVGLMIVGKTSSRFVYRRQGHYNHVLVGKHLRTAAAT